MAKKQTINDSMDITINFKWLLQLIVLVSVAVYGFWQLENRIAQLENNVNSAMDQLMIIEEERKIQSEANLQELKKELSWYQKELNLNPFSWGKSKEK
jgi:predicted nuclease of restriction endonuclease-like RecB superfamily